MKFDGCAECLHFWSHLTSTLINCSLPIHLSFLIACFPFLHTAFLVIGYLLFSHSISLVHHHPIFNPPSHCLNRPPLIDLSSLSSPHHCLPPSFYLFGSFWGKQRILICFPMAYSLRIRVGSKTSSLIGNSPPAIRPPSDWTTDTSAVEINRWLEHKSSQSHQPMPGIKAPLHIITKVAAYTSVAQKQR